MHRPTLKSEFQFQPVKFGMIVAKLFSLSKIQRNIINIHVAMRRKDENQPRLSKTIRDDSEVRYFGEEELLVWIDETNWFKTLDIELRDGEIILGVHRNFSLLSYMTKFEDKPCVVTFQDPNKNGRGESKAAQVGEQLAKFEFLTADELTVQIRACKNLRRVDAHSQTEPYVVAESDGKASNLVKKTCTCKDGSMDPKWDQTLTFMVVDHYSLIFSCDREDALSGEDELVGEAKLSLLPVYKKGLLDIWVELKFKNEVRGESS